MDFITHLPVYTGHTVIMVVIDRFSKAAHFGTLPTTFSASQATELFSKIICKLQGYPNSIICDRDPIFVSKFRKTLF